MIKGKDRLLFFAAGFMELSWIYAIAVFCLVLLECPGFPLLEAAVTFFLAAIITSFYRGRGWRVIHALILHLLGFSASSLVNLYAFYGYTDPFFSRYWVLELFSQPREPLEGLVFGLIIILSAAFWAGGLFHGLRPASYLAITTRFDLGITVFFFILLICGGIGIENSAGELLLFPFFLLSMLSIVLARNRGSGRREYLAGYRGVGLVLVFAFIVILFTGSMLLLFLPYLTMTAEAGYTVIKKVAGPLGPVLITILRFLFARGSLRSEAGGDGLAGDGTIENVEALEGGWWTEIFEKVIGWGVTGLLLLIGLFIAGWGIRNLLRWLFSRTPGSREHRSIREEFLLWLEGWWTRLQAFFSSARKYFTPSSQCQKQILVFYRRLLIWGRTSGFPHFSCETPSEYGLRLGNHFPGVKKEVELIIDNFNHEIYGKKPLERENLLQLRQAWRRLNNPLHWPIRFKMWFSRGGAGL